MAKKTKSGYAYTDKTKIEVVTTYLALGSAPLTEAVTGVPRDTIRHWKLSSWWKDIERELRDAENIELSAKLKKIVDKSLEVVADRLEDGDHMFDNRTGKIIRVPLKARDALKAIDSMFDKRQVLLDKPTKIVEQRTVEDRLNKLAEEFSRFAKARTIEGTPATITASTDDYIVELIPSPTPDETNAVESL